MGIKPTFYTEDRNILKYVGDIKQIASIQEYRLMGGRQDGVRAAHFQNGSGLEFTVLPDKAMDISSIRYKGIPK